MTEVLVAYGETKLAEVPDGGVNVGQMLLDIVGVQLLRHALARRGLSEQRDDPHPPPKATT